MKRLFLGFSKEEKSSWLLFIAAWVVYAVISMTKSAYAASMASIIEEGLFTKANSGVINASFYLFYGTAQLIGAKAVDKVSPVTLIYITLFGTLISVVGMAMSESFYVMLLLWSFCGLIQFAIWPAVLRIIAEFLLPDHRNKAMVYIAFSYCAGMLINYLIAAIVLEVASWHTMFWVTGVIVAISIVLWWCVTKRTKSYYTEQQEINRAFAARSMESKKASVPTAQIGYFKLLVKSGVIILMLSALIRNSLDSGLKLWVPTMITENYPVTPSFASMLTTILVFINLAGVFITSWIYPKRTKNPVWAYGLCFLTVLPFTVLLLLTGRLPVLVVVLLLAVVTTMMYAGHQLINVIIPSCFAPFGRAGSIAAVLNAIASFGTIAANMGFGIIAENYGWTTTIATWIVLAAAAFVLCCIATPVWHKFTTKE